MGWELRPNSDSGYIFPHWSQLTSFVKPDKTKKESNTCLLFIELCPLEDQIMVWTITIMLMTAKSLQCHHFQTPEVHQLIGASSKSGCYSYSLTDEETGRQMIGLCEPVWTIPGSGKVKTRTQADLRDRAFALRSLPPRPQKETFKYCCRTLEGSAC